MSLRARIDELNAYDPSRYVAFRIAGAQVGWVRREALAALRQYADVFEVGEEGVALSPRLATPAARTRAVAGAARDLFARGLVPEWRGEDYPVVPLDDRGLQSAPLMRLERAAAAFFGVRTFGVHLTGFVDGGRGLGMWIAERAASQREHPGKLDQIAAGGLTAGLEPAEALVKEAWEEAGIDERLARAATPCGLISYCAELAEGLSPATVFAFELELAADFVPRNRDGEVGAFRLVPADEALALAAEGRAFKPNCGLVVIDFALRHGLVAAPEARGLAESLWR